MNKLFEYHNYNTGPYIHCLGFDLFLARREYRGTVWSLNSDGAFAICTPYFTLLLPWISSHVNGIGRAA